MYLKINQAEINTATLYFLFNPPKVSFTTGPLSVPSHTNTGFNMAPRTSKNKSNAEKGAIAPVPTTTGRQRTMSTKQQLLRKSFILRFYIFKFISNP